MGGALSSNFLWFRRAWVPLISPHAETCIWTIIRCGRYQIWLEIIHSKSSSIHSYNTSNIFIFIFIDSDTLPRLPRPGPEGGDKPSHIPYVCPVPGGRETAPSHAAHVAQPSAWQGSDVCGAKPLRDVPSCPLLWRCFWTAPDSLSRGGTGGTGN